jgi:acetyltransferase-like isoleucine patch superfamily enzyme
MAIIAKSVIIHDSAIIYDPVSIDDGCYVGENCIIGYPAKKELSRLIEKGSSHFERTDNVESHIGQKVILRPRCTIYEGVKVGNNVEFGTDALVREDTVIGDDTIIGSKVVIDGYSHIGSRTLLHTNVYICAYSTIGDGVFIGPGVVFTNDKYANRMPVELKGPIIKDRACIGAGAIILPGVTVAEGSLIGSGAVVTRDTEPDAVYIGNPARKLKKVSEIVRLD